MELSVKRFQNVVNMKFSLIISANAEKVMEEETETANKFLHVTQDSIGFWKIGNVYVKKDTFLKEQDVRSFQDVDQMKS